MTTRRIRRRELFKGAVAAHGLMTGAAVSRATALAAKGILLRDYPITHGGLQRVFDPDLGAEVIGQTCIRYLRFAGPVVLERFELPRIDYGRGRPNAPTHRGCCLPPNRNGGRQTDDILRTGLLVRIVSAK